MDEKRVSESAYIPCCCASLDGNGDVILVIEYSLIKVMIHRPEIGVKSGTFAER